MARDLQDLQLLENNNIEKSEEKPLQKPKIKKEAKSEIQEEEPEVKPIVKRERTMAIVMKYPIALSIGTARETRQVTTRNIT